MYLQRVAVSHTQRKVVRHHLGTKTFITRKMLILHILLIFCCKLIISIFLNSSRFSIFLFFHEALFSYKLRLYVKHLNATI